MAIIQFYHLLQRQQAAAVEVMIKAWLVLAVLVVVVHH
jgi:hypothetical protein